MAEIVLKIPEETYKNTCNGSMLPPDVTNVINAIKNSTPLPKGHGKLIDADEQIFKIEEIYNGYMLSEDGGVVPNDFVEFLEEAPTIIEADKN